MTERPVFKEWKSILWAIRIYALIIIGAVLISVFTTWLAEDTARFLIMLMAILMISVSFQPYLAEHEKARKWLMIGLIVLMLLGILVFFLVTLR